MPRKIARAYRVLMAFSHSNSADRNRLSGALRFASSRTNWDVRILDTASPTLADDCRRTLSNWQVDGIVSSEPARLLKLLPPRQAAHVRTAAIDSCTIDEDIDISIRLDAKQLVDAAIALLRRRGFDSIAFFGTDYPYEREWSGDVETVFRKALGRGLLPDSIFRTSVRDSFSDELAAVSEWASRLPKPCGVLAYSDSLARILLDACRLAKVRVPEQIAILGVDDSAEICETSRPTISSILPDFEISGFLAAKMMDGAFRSPNRKTQRRTYGLKHVTERESTQDQRGAGRIASAILTRVQNRALDPNFGIGTLCRELNASTRLLELHFKQVMGHSIKKEITRLRLSALQDQLKKTHTPIATLIEHCGFRTISAAHAAFRKATGVSMTAWRFRNRKTRAVLPGQVVE